MSIKNPQASVGQNPMVTVFLTCIFSVSFLSGSNWHYVFTLVAVLLFLIYNAISIARVRPGIACFLRRQYPLAFYLFTAFLVSSVLTMIVVSVSDNPPGQKVVQWLKYAFYLAMTAYCVSLAWFCALNRLSFQRIYLVYSAGLWVLILSLLTLYFGFDAPNYRSWGIDPPVGGHVRIMGMYASVAITVLLVQLMFAVNSRFYAVLSYLSLFVFMTFLVWSGSRVSIVLVFFMLALLAAVQLFIKKQWPLKAIPVFLLFVLAMPLGDSMVDHDWGGLGRFTKPVSVSVEQQHEATDFADNVSSGRVKMWINALEVIQSAPLFGTGAFGYYFYPDKPMLSDHVHNVVLQFLVEWGLIGGGLLSLLIVWLFIGMLCQVKRAVINGDTALLMTASVLVLLSLNGLTDGTYSVLFPLFMVVTAYAHLLVKPLQRLILVKAL